MEWTKEEYDRLVQSLTPPSPLGKDLLWAFFVGGAICTLGQWLSNWYQSLGLERDAVADLIRQSWPNWPEKLPEPAEA